MSRKKAPKTPFERSAVPQSSERIQFHISNALETLGHLSGIYDGGYHAIAFTMATEVNKLLTENALAARARGQMKFISPQKSKLTLTARNLLIGARIQADHLSFCPMFEVHGSLDQYTELRFVDWWSREKIYIASCAKPDVPLGMIPLREEDQLKDHERENFTRRDFVYQLRNKLGAHIDDELPALLDDLLRPESFGLSFASGVVPFGTDMPMKVSPVAAMMREIVFELTHSFASSNQIDAVAASTRDT